MKTPIKITYWNEARGFGRAAVEETNEVLFVPFIELPGPIQDCLRQGTWITGAVFLCEIEDPAPGKPNRRATKLFFVRW